MKKYLISGYNYSQDVLYEPGTYTIVVTVKSMFGDIYSFSLWNGTEWEVFDIETVKDEWKKIYLTFTITDTKTKFNPISRYFDATNKVFVLKPQIVKGNIPSEPGSSPFDIDQIVDDLHDEIDSIADFTNEAFADRVLSASEKVSLKRDLEVVETIFQSLKGSFEKLLVNPFISDAAMFDLQTNYSSVVSGKALLFSVINGIIDGDDIVTDDEILAKDTALSMFNVALYNYNQTEKEIYNDLGEDYTQKIAELKDFTEGEFEDRVLTNAEKISLSHDLDNVQMLLEELTASYEELLLSEYITTNNKLLLESKYVALLDAWELDGDPIEPDGLKTVILDIINGDDIIDPVEIDEKDLALAAFNAALSDYSSTETSLRKAADGFMVSTTLSSYAYAVDKTGVLKSPLSDGEILIDIRRGLPIPCGGVSVEAPIEGFYKVTSLVASAGLTISKFIRDDQFGFVPTAFTVDSGSVNFTVSALLGGEIYTFNRAVWYKKIFDGIDGEDGIDGKGVEFIFSNINIVPTVPATSEPNYQNDDYTGLPGSGWQDNSMTPTVNNPTVYVSERKKVNGVWGAFSAPSVWSNFATDGEDGIDGFTVSLSKYSHTYAYDKNGVIKGLLSDGTAIIRVYNGSTLFLCGGSSTDLPTSDLTYKITAIVAEGLTAGFSIIDNQYHVFPTAFPAGTGKITLTIVARLNGVNYTFVQVVTYDKSADGQDGEDGGDGHSPFIDPATNTWWTWDIPTGAFIDTGIAPVGADGAMPYPGGYYDDTKLYTRTADATPYVQYGAVLYLLKTNPGVAGVPPTNTTYWRTFDSFEAVFINSLVANFANIGGAVFTGNTPNINAAIAGKLISQKGVDGTSDFQNYSGSAGLWQPKILIDFINGLIIGDDVKIRGEIDALTGTLGELTIAAGGFIDLPPQFTSNILGRIDSTGIQLVYSGADSQSISWYTGMGIYSGNIKPNSSGRLVISSNYGLDFNSEGDINIGKYDIGGTVYIGSSLKSVNFGGAAVSNISRLASLGLTSFAFSTLAMAASTNYTVSSDTTMLVITSSGGSAGILKLMAEGGASPSNGMVKIIVNTTSVKVYLRCTTAGTNILYGSPITEYQMHANSVALLVYYSGAWRVHSDVGQ